MYEQPASIGKYQSDPSAEVKPRGVIYTVAPSPRDANRIWAGTDDGLIHLTSDGGKNWTNVTPPQISAWQKISLIDAGHFDANIAYAAVNTLRLDDLRPHIYRTTDAGKTWEGEAHPRCIPDGQTVNVVREISAAEKDSSSRGPSARVYVSFDDGDTWRSLRLNMTGYYRCAISLSKTTILPSPRTAAVFGYSITSRRYVNYTARQADAPILFKPQTAMRVRWNLNTDHATPAGRTDG